MESIMFAVWLWFVAFSVGCWFVSPLSSSAPVFVSEPETEVSEALTEIEKENKKQGSVYVASVESSVEVQSTSLDVDSLSLRELRQVIRALNEGLAKNDPQRIRQKVNKKDAPLDWLKSQVKTRLKEEPHQLENVLAALAA
jgi:hypothetical protein